MIKHLRIIGCYLRINLASSLEYRASFFTQAFGMALSNSSFLFFWWIAFSQLGGTIAGYSFRDIQFIWAVTSTAFGLSGILFAGAKHLTRLIVTGELDTFLLQPCNILLNVVFARTTLSSYGDVAYGVILMLLSHRRDGAAWLWFTLGALAGAVLMAAIALAGNSLTFYVGDASAVSNMATEFVVNFSIYPERIYGPAVRALMYSLVPAGFMVHMPLRLAKSFSPLHVLLFAGAVIAYCALSATLFYRGLRRYESGNVLSVRM